MKTLLPFLLAPLALAANYPTTDMIEGIPEPPIGKRWVLNEQFSDEFNGRKLDDKKWLDYHPNWKGRAPGLFEPQNVSLKDGMLVMQGSKMKKPQIIKSWDGKDIEYNISCAAVVSKTLDAHYGYYECRFKANKTTLSATFWLSTRGKGFYISGRLADDGRPGTVNQELDICECIGRSGDFSGKNFYKGMNANIHYWFTPNGGQKEDIRATEVRLQRPDGQVPSDDFNTYGCWWRDSCSASFYLNNEQETTREFISKDGKIPFIFPNPMGLNMVMETYMEPWVELPNERELSDPKKNCNYYDWVRSYILLDVDAPSTGKVDADIFKPQLRFTEKPQKIDVIDHTTKLGTYLIVVKAAYCASEDFTPILMIRDKANRTIASKSIKAACGYSHRELSIEAKLSLNETYTAVIYYQVKDGKKSTMVGDHFRFAATQLR